jgi:hypothetical protein
VITFKAMSDRVRYRWCREKLGKQDKACHPMIGARLTMSSVILAQVHAARELCMLNYACFALRTMLYHPPYLRHRHDGPLACQPQALMLVAPAGAKACPPRA